MTCQELKSRSRQQTRFDLETRYEYREAVLEWGPRTHSGTWESAPESGERPSEPLGSSAAERVIVQFVHLTRMVPSPKSFVDKVYEVFGSYRIKCEHAMNQQEMRLAV